MKFKDFSELEKQLPEEVKENANKKAQEMLLQLSLAEIRTERHITQKELAERLKVNQAAISKLEKRSGISLSKLQQIINAMGGELEINIKFPDKKIELKPSFQG
jgi:DNA-binding Xre family transcriptional regulator